MHVLYSTFLKSIYHSPFFLLCKYIRGIYYISIILIFRLSLKNMISGITFLSTCFYNILYLKKSNILLFLLIYFLIHMVTSENFFYVVLSFFVWNFFYKFIVVICSIFFYPFSYRTFSTIISCYYH